MIFFCTSCWAELDKDNEHCPVCGCDCRKLSDGQDYVEKLIAALNHPEPETPIRAAWILGQLHDERAICPLYNVAKRTVNAFLRVAAIKALLGIGTDEANELAELCLQNTSEMERRMVADQGETKRRPR
ncbi:MAG: HEAT repeat domain-containing protein [Candidatus Zixiibacteriota bacterium]|nr:MAG: HEAT repeat domain-containing protein [candidate division Zixibacteria bacterium]